ncbi:hypothetical protein JAAARDRAFT_46548 [Jaapia argillacea MUCL 33604]|uniref:Uncharacterized protein n=1 Tax=Jaapia argillacea MUCL 33604 TaxID=933084 RepID=A0A067PVN6_9AGAM|nr:hypothetical protein JAAARDRAFT_46548 [Jaapia argillacea MUCL 33604]
MSYKIIRIDVPKRSAGGGSTSCGIVELGKCIRLGGGGGWSGGAWLNGGVGSGIGHELEEDVILDGGVGLAVGSSDQDEAKTKAEAEFFEVSDGDDLNGFQILGRDNLPFPIEKFKGQGIRLKGQINEVSPLIRIYAIGVWDWKDNVEGMGQRGGDGSEGTLVRAAALDFEVIQGEMNFGVSGEGQREVKQGGHNRYFLSIRDLFNHRYDRRPTGNRNHKSMKVEKGKKE